MVHLNPDHFLQTPEGRVTTAERNVWAWAKCTERAPILAVAQRYGVPAVAVWLRTPLDECLARNAARPPDEVANERGLRNVFAALEPPEEEEGFAEVVVVDAADLGGPGPA
jgi:predicted kinase